MLTIKGAPDVIIGRCSSFVDSSGQTEALDADTRASIEALKNRWSSQGKRVILLARKVIKAGQIQSQPISSSYEGEVSDLARNNLTLVGLVGIVDPPRDEIPEVVRVLRGAGIRIFMVSMSVTSSSIILTYSGHW